MMSNSGWKNFYNYDSPYEMRYWRFRVTILVLALFAFLAAQNTLARIAWQKYRAPAVALFLDRGDAQLAMQIGNYYFNGGRYDLEIVERAYRKAVAIDPKVLWGALPAGEKRLN